LTVNEAAVLPANDRQIGIRVHVTLEVGLYALIVALALALHLVQLGRAPLQDAEAHDALAAYRAVHDQATGETIVPDSPLSFWFNAPLMAVFPVDDGLARLPVAVASVVLVLLPALWRRYLGPLAALIISGLLCISPVVMLAGRTSSPVIWTMLLAVIAPWLLLRFIDNRRPGWAVLATACGGAMILLAEPAGFLTFLALAFGVVFAWLTEMDPDADITGGARRLAQDWPWTNGLIALGVALFVVGTGLFILPANLSGIGNVLWQGVQGFGERLDGAPVAFPLLVALRYEIGMVVFGIIACYRAVREGGFFERALVGWFVGGLVWALVYAGAGAGHALWLVMPLSVLVGLMVARWIVERPSIQWKVPEWGVPLHLVLTTMLWFVVGMALVIIGKALLVGVPAGVDDGQALLETLFDKIYNNSGQNADMVYIQDQGIWARYLGDIQYSAVLGLLMLMGMGVLFFLVGSVWGARASWRGLALGTLVYCMLISVGFSVRAALDKLGDPRELWTNNPVTRDVHELRDSLLEFSLRDKTLDGAVPYGTGTPNLMSVTAWVPQDGAVAWALRDFTNTTFVDGVGPEVKTAVVIAPDLVENPALGAEYVGKRLVIRQAWDRGTLSWHDGLMWLYRSDSIQKPTAGEVMMLWVRKDIYGVEHVTEE